MYNYKRFKMKICPKCKSGEVFAVAGGIMGSWECQECGFLGAIFPEIEKIEGEDDE